MSSSSILTGWFDKENSCKNNPIAEWLMKHEQEMIDAADYNQMDNYYYWQETGGNVPMGFASLKSVESLGDGRYAVRFDIYGAGEEWTNDVCALTAEEAAQRYEKFSEGMAVIATDNSLANRGALWLERWIVR